MRQSSQSYFEAFFGAGLDRVETRGFSHDIRWTNTARLHRYFTSDVQAAIGRVPQQDFERLQSHQAEIWDTIARAQYNEVTTFLDPYLLSSQGDRVAMAHAVEGRFPFLDYRVVEFCNSLPAGMKMRGLREKALLKDAMSDLLPADILTRPKQPFRAPIRAAFAQCARVCR
jgi:asparagine synthase (glutamine-hydrolysing)